jgi:rubrerythrin
LSGTGEKHPNIFPGNWDVETPTLLKAYELWFPQNWSPVDLNWDELDPKNFSREEGLAQAYWMAKLALFEKSGIGAFGLAALQAGRHNLEDPTKKFLAAVTYDECRHDEICRRACSRVCPNFPYRFSPKSDLEEKALRNINALYVNGARYWSAFEEAWEKYPLELIFSSFFFAEVGAQLIFGQVGERSKLSVYRDSFTKITRDESRHLTGTLAMLEKLAGRMGEKQRLAITRQMKHGFIYLSPLLFKPVGDFWDLPHDFYEVDSKLEGLASDAGLGVPNLQERSEAWLKAIERHRSKLESLGVHVPRIEEIGLDGVDVNVKKGDRIITAPL